MNARVSEIRRRFCTSTMRKWNLSVRSHQNIHELSSNMTLFRKILDRRRHLSCMKNSTSNVWLNERVNSFVTKIHAWSDSLSRNHWPMHSTIAVSPTRDRNSRSHYSIDDWSIHAESDDNWTEYIGRWTKEQHWCFTSSTIIQTNIDTSRSYSCPTLNYQSTIHSCLGWIKSIEI